MKNKELYEQKVEDGSLVRYEIQEDHASEVNQLAKIYKGFFGRNPKEFKIAKDIKYYTGGWPNADSPAKAQQLADRIADAYMILSFIGYEDDLNMHLRNRGLEIIPVKEGDAYHYATLCEDIDWEGDKKRKKLVEENWSQLFDYDMPGEPKEVLTALMDRACDKQRTICELSDTIKLDMGAEVEEECDIKVGHYTKAVNLKYQVQKGKDISEILQKMEEESASIMESLEIFD